MLWHTVYKSAAPEWATQVFNAAPHGNELAWGAFLGALVGLIIEAVRVPPQQRRWVAC